MCKDRGELAPIIIIVALHSFNCGYKEDMVCIDVYLPWGNKDIATSLSSVIAIL